MNAEHYYRPGPPTAAGKVFARATIKENIREHVEISGASEGLSARRNDLHRFDGIGMV